MTSNREYKSEYENEIRLLLLGKTGAGKSSFGNVLYGSKTKKFPFVTGASSSSITNKSAYASRDYENHRLLIIDTPGLFDTNNLDNNKTLKEIDQGFLLASPGPHAFLIVIQGRCTEEEENVLALLQKKFGSEVADYCIIVITHEDELRDNDYQTSDDQIIKRYLENAPDILTDMVQKCSNRCFIINSRAQFHEREKKIKNLIDIVNRMQLNNKNEFYNHEMFNKAEKQFQQWENDVLEQYKKQSEERRKQLFEEIRQENLPREEQIKSEEEINEHFHQELKVLQKQIRDISRTRLLNKTYSKLSNMIQYVSELLPPPHFSF